jgi:hypothetical protein
MQLDDKSIHKFFANKTLRHTNTSSIKITIFYIMKTLHNLNNDMHAHDCPFIPCETFLSFIPWGLPSLSFLCSCPCSCFMLYNSNSILLLFANHAFFKYAKPINMKFYHSTLHNLNLNCSSHSNTLDHFNTFHPYIIS